MSESILQYYIGLAEEGTKASSDEGFKIMAYYLFHGTQIQRNYSTLYFGRRGEYLIIRKAYAEGLIDAKQAFSK